jgi:hypothetical protein
MPPPTPKGRTIKITAYKDVDFARDVVTGRSGRSEKVADSRVSEGDRPALYYINNKWQYIPYIVSESKRVRLARKVIFPG